LASTEFFREVLQGWPRLTTNLSEWGGGLLGQERVKEGGGVRGQSQFSSNGTDGVGREVMGQQGRKT